MILSGNSPLLISSVTHALKIGSNVVVIDRNHTGKLSDYVEILLSSEVIEIQDPVYTPYNITHLTNRDNYLTNKVQQRRKALIANHAKKQGKGTPKGARKREKRFVTVY